MTGDTGGLKKLTSSRDLDLDPKKLMFGGGDWLEIGRYELPFISSKPIVFAVGIELTPRPPRPALPDDVNWVTIEVEEFCGLLLDVEEEFALVLVDILNSEGTFNSELS